MRPVTAPADQWEIGEGGPSPGNGWHFALDSLGSAKHLRDAAVPQDQAEARAEAARQFVMAELVTRYG